MRPYFSITIWYRVINFILVFCLSLLPCVFSSRGEMDTPTQVAGIAEGNMYLMKGIPLILEM